jgi:NADPH:quinone reductase-like Zn-dependent oxidoreductase
MVRAVRFNHYGGIEVLQVEDVELRKPAADEVLVQVRAAGINPGEARIRTGAAQARFPAAFDAATELETKAEASVAGTSTAVLAEIAGLAADGRIQVPIAAAYSLERVRDAFAELEQGHTLGKIVLVR